MGESVVTQWGGGGLFLLLLFPPDQILLKDLMPLLGGWQDPSSQHLGGQSRPGLLLTLGRMAGPVAVGVASFCRPVAPPYLAHQVLVGCQQCLRAGVGVQTSLPLKGQGAERGHGEASWVLASPAW